MNTSLPRPAASVGTDPLQAELAALYAQYVRYQNLKDLPGLMSCLHTDSTWRTTISKMFEPQFDNHTLNKEVHFSAYGGNDGEYAYYRFTQTLRRIAGPPFPENRTENLAIFRREGTGWKIWNCSPIWIEPL